MTAAWRHCLAIALPSELETSTGHANGPRTNCKAYEGEMSRRKRLNVGSASVEKLVSPFLCSSFRALKLTDGEAH